MFILNQIPLLLLLLHSFSNAAPSSGSIQKRSFKVERIPNPSFQGRSPGAGTRALIKAHRKFQFDLPQGLLDSMRHGNAGSGEAAVSVESASNTNKFSFSNGTKSQVGHKAADPNPSGIQEGGPQSTGKVTATPVNGDVEYLSPINIGGQTITMDFDTGSADLWVFSTQLNQRSILNHTAYDSKKSETFTPMDGATFRIAYGDGSGASGNVGTEVVNIGGATVTKQAVELATAVSQSFTQDTDSNGLVGLAFSKLNTVKPTQQKTFFDNLKSTLPIPVFTADLRHNAVGSYEFGKIDESKFNGKLSWASVDTTNGFWQFSTNKFQVGDNAPVDSPNGQAIADTGTTLMLTTPTIVNEYYSQVNGAILDPQVGGVVFPCDTNLPDLKVDVGGNYMATVRGKHINFAPVDVARTMCFGGLQGIQSNLQIYGDILFKSQFVAFNGGNNSLGMAPHQ